MSHSTSDSAPPERRACCSISAVRVPSDERLRRPVSGSSTARSRWVSSPCIRALVIVTTHTSSAMAGDQALGIAEHPLGIHRDRGQQHRDRGEQCARGHHLPPEAGGGEGHGTIIQESEGLSSPPFIAVPRP